MLFILFWLFVAVVLGLFWVLSLVLFLVGKSRQISWLSWLGGIPLFSLSFGALAMVALTMWSAYDTSRPATVYTSSFGIEPSSDVSHLQSSYSSFGDYGSAYLKFDASPATVGRITAKGWKRRTPREAGYVSDSLHQSEDTPVWWKPVLTPSSVIYTASKRSDHFASEEETLMYDKSSRQAYYFYLGVD